MWQSELENDDIQWFKSVDEFENYISKNKEKKFDAVICDFYFENHVPVNTEQVKKIRSRELSLNFVPWFLSSSLPPKELDQEAFDNIFDPMFYSAI